MAEDNKDLTVEGVDDILKEANGDPYGSPPCVASYLKYIMGKRVMSVFLLKVTLEELKDVHLLITTSVMDGSLELSLNMDRSLLLAFCANRVVEKLQVNGVECEIFKPLKEQMPEEV